MKRQAITTGIFDFHKLTASILISSFSIGNHKTILYRDYKNFYLNNFNIAPKKALIKAAYIKYFFNIKTNNEADLLKFICKPIQEDVLKKIIVNLNSKKGALHDCIPVTLLKDSCDLYISQLKDIINHSLEKYFPTN